MFNLALPLVLLLKGKSLVDPDRGGVTLLKSYLQLFSDK
jgi:hypothetical protein